MFLTAIVSIIFHPQVTQSRLLEMGQMWECGSQCPPSRPPPPPPPLPKGTASATPTPSTTTSTQTPASTTSVAACRLAKARRVPASSHLETNLNPKLKESLQKIASDLLILPWQCTCLYRSYISLYYCPFLQSSFFEDLYSAPFCVIVQIVWRKQSKRCWWEAFSSCIQH